VQSIDGRPVYAATDLVAFLACEHLTELERAAMAGLVERPMRADPELDIIRKRGFEHEARYLADLQAEGRSVTRIELDGSIEDDGDRLRAAAQATIAAMAAGDDVIYQATFFDGTWRGHADFLLRVESTERPSTWGPYHYEVADTKLARHVKASAVLQICSYIDQLERLQGVRPEWLHVALGGSARTIERLRVDDYMAYYRAAKERFLDAVSDRRPVAFPPTGTYPEPVDHCEVCRWAAECSAQRRADDHLSLVAGISGRQRRALTERGVTTLEALGDLALPLQPKLQGTSEGALLRVHEQARIQLEGDIPLVLGNQAGLTQVFSNLLGNALKFARPGQIPEVLIRAERVPAQPAEATGNGAGTQRSPDATSNPLMPGHWVRIWIEDKGVGIPQAMVPRIFNLFARGTTKQEGTGLGLALVRKVVGRMGGRVGVESQEGRGSRFWFELLPGDPRQQMAVPVASPPPGPGKIL